MAGPSERAFAAFERQREKAHTRMRHHQNKPVCPRARERNLNGKKGKQRHHQEKKKKWGRTREHTRNAHTTNSG